MSTNPTTFKDRATEYVNSEEFFSKVKACINSPSPETDKCLKALSWLASHVTPKLSSSDPDLEVGGDITINFNLDNGPDDNS